LDKPGVEYLAFCSYFDPSKGPKSIKLIGHQRILRDAWDNALKAGLRSIQGKVVGMEDYFDVKPLSDNSSFYWEDIQFSIVQSVHIMDGYSIVPSYGLMIKDTNNDKKVYITSDSQFNPNQIKDFYDQADIIIQDCETAPFQSGVHAHYTELATLSDNIRSKMILIHYQDNIINEWDSSQKKAKGDGFIGFAKPGIDVLTQTTDSEIK